MERGNKSEAIRKLLLETIGKSPDLFCYFAAIQEAKELLGQQAQDESYGTNVIKPIKKLVDG